MGCKVILDEKHCKVIYDGDVILTGYKDSVSDLWILPILQDNPVRTVLMLCINHHLALA